MKKDKKQNRRISMILDNSTLIDAVFGLDVEVTKISDKDIKLITNDLSFTQADQSRKAVIKRKALNIICDDEDINKNLKRCFNIDIIAQILDTYLYGFNVFEINYKEKNGLFYPVLVQRDYRNFKIKDGILEFNRNGVFYEVPKYKAVYGLSGANFLNPYGVALISKLYYPIKMKNSGLRFWISFLEKFGSPWAIAKTDFDAEGLAKELFSMLSGDVAVIDKDEEISITQPGKDSSHDKLISYCDEQIRNVILGGNLTSNVSSGSLAAANIHNQIREDISISDENIVLDVFKRTIKIFKEINGLNLDIDVVLINKADGDLDLADRDLKLFNMGFVPSKEYIEKTYGVILDEEKMKDFIKTKNENENLKPNKTVFKESLKKPKYLDKFDKALDSKEFSDGLKKADDELEKALNEILSKCDTYEEAFNEFMRLYDAPLVEMENLMFKAVANSQVVGMFEEDKK